MQNQTTEEINEVVKKTNEKIERSAREMKNRDGYPIGCMVENMKPYILSDICLLYDDNALIPSVKQCQHSGKNRRVW